MMSYSVGDANEVLNSLNLGTISPSFYDMAWVLRSNALSKEDQRNLLKKILTSQHPDGSWGASVHYLHDRIINTLSVLVAFLEQQEISGRLKAIRYLQEAIPKLLDEQIETIGFELIFPSLLQQAHQFKVELPYDCTAVKHYQKSSESIIGNVSEILAPPNFCQCCQR